MVLTLYFSKRQIQPLSSDTETRVLNEMDEKTHNIVELVLERPSLSKVMDGPIGSIEDISAEEVKAQFETNVFGVFRVTQAVLPYMRKQHNGMIVNISSLAGRVGPPLLSAYGSTKFALEGMSESMTYELEPFGIKVVIIEVGNIKTNFRSEKAARATKDSPYYTMTQSTIETIEGMVKQGINPIEVAKAIIHAIDNPKPKLRYPVGKDAEELIEASRNLSEEDFFRVVAQNVLNR